MICVDSYSCDWRRSRSASRSLQEHAQIPFWLLGPRVDLAVGVEGRGVGQYIVPVQGCEVVCDGGEEVVADGRADGAGSFLPRTNEIGKVSGMVCLSSTVRSSR
jgi:hypothetical protein